MSKVVCFLGNRNVQLSKHAWEFGRKIISGKTSLKGEFFHVISSSRKVPQVFLYILTARIETREKMFSISFIIPKKTFYTHFLYRLI
jgi:hypothetical protein